MEKCVTPSPKGSDSWKPFSERLNDVPARISSGSIDGVTVEMYKEDNIKWKKHVDAYRQINKIIDSGRYRNILDMNAGLGSFAAALDSPKLWVMNVVPTIAEKNTLSAIFDRGLIGIYHDWYEFMKFLYIMMKCYIYMSNHNRLVVFGVFARCEAFSTYPRTYDLIHANGVFSLYKNK